MFDGPEYKKSLSEEVFNQWLEDGRMSLLGHHYLLVIWDDYEAAYQPVYVTRRQDIEPYRNSVSREKLIAAYDLYSESRVV